MSPIHLQDKTIKNFMPRLAVFCFIRITDQKILRENNFFQIVVGLFKSFMRRIIHQCKKKNNSFVECSVATVK